MSRENVEIAREVFHRAFVRWDLDGALQLIDAETVILVTLAHARGKGSGVPVRAGGASIWIVRHGKVTRVKLFQSEADALDAVGLSE